MAGNTNQRKYPRVKAPKSAVVAWQTLGYREVSRVDNLGLGGLFISTKNPARYGAMIQLLIVSPRGHVRVRAEVKSVIEGKGMGVAIMSMDQEDRGKLERWLKQLETGSETPVAS